jgi:hypothetical protein
MSIVEDYWAALGSEEPDELVESENVTYELPPLDDEQTLYWGA